MSRVEFYDACGRYRVSVFNYANEDAEAELRRDLQTLQQRSAS